MMGVRARVRSESEEETETETADGETPEKKSLREEEEDRTHPGESNETEAQKGFREFCLRKQRGRKSQSSIIANYLFQGLVKSVAEPRPITNSPPPKNHKQSSHSHHQHHQSGRHRDHGVAQRRQRSSNISQFDGLTRFSRSRLVQHPCKQT